MKGGEGGEACGAKEAKRGRGGGVGAGVGTAKVGCTPRGSCNNTLLRRVLRRFSNSKCFLEWFLEGACKDFQSRQGS